MFDVAALGEALIDFTPAGSTESGNAHFEQNPGGAPANVLAALAKLGKKTSFIGKVGADPFGRFLTETLEAYGIHTSGVVRTGEASTTLAFVHLDEFGDRTFSFVRKPGADVLLTESEVDYSIVEASKIFHFGSISMTDEPVRAATLKALSIAKAAGAVVSFDPNFREALWSNLEGAREMIGLGLTYADVLKISEEELEWIAGTSSLVQGSQYIRSNFGVRIILVTLAEKGCFIRKGDATLSVPGYPAKVVDTTGAGDAFLGGFLYQLLNRECRIDDLSEDELYSMVRFANAVGAFVTTRKGAIPAMPTLSEIGEMMLTTALPTQPEKYRPQYHFTPSTGWLNDPNGLVFFEGEYHLFYQHYPEKNVWGPMHWGHAVSTDMVHWEHRPIALAPDHNGMIFSGCAVVDWRDTSGFFNGEAGLVAVFTHADTYPHAERPRQRQSLAFSSDKGRTWTMFEGNPVLIDIEITDFRDPKVFWHEAGNRWVMVLAAGDRVRFYASRNLKEWTFTGEFGKPYGSHAGVWECPDLFELPVDGEPGNGKWVLLVSIGDSPDFPEGSRTQYFIGQFDGYAFTSDLKPEEVQWMDFGRDHYAGVTWSDVPQEDGRRLLIGWMSNWKYANQTPTVEWRSAMTLPRSLSLARTAEGIRLYSKPIEEIRKLRGEPKSLPSMTVGSSEHELSDLAGDCFEVEAEFEWSEEAEFGIKVRRSDREETVIGFHSATGELFINRTRAGESDFHEAFPCQHGAIVHTSGNRVSLRVFVDRSSVEVFAEGGQIVLTDLIFPEPTSKGLAIYSKGGEAKLNSFIYYPLKSIHEQRNEEKR